MIDLARFGAVTILLALSAAPAAAQDPAKPTDAVIACRAELDEAARLRCYDSAAATLAEAVGRGAIVVVDREEVRQTRRSLFGFSLPNLPFFRGDSSTSEPVEELRTTIKAAEADRYRKLTLVLEDGAVWRTTEATRSASMPRAGQEVTIRKGTMGGFWLTVERQRPLRAVRVR